MNDELKKLLNSSAEMIVALNKYGYGPKHPLTIKATSVLLLLEKIKP